MDKNFIENCKLLKRHFTKLTQADTTAQSSYKNSTEEDTVNVIINNAKQLLLDEQIEELSSDDIARIKEKTVDEYATELQKYDSEKCTRLCKNEYVDWNDEIFNSTLPHPKKNSEYLKLQKKNIQLDIDNERKEIEELANIILNKYESLEIHKKSISQTNKNELKIRIEEKINENTPVIIEKELNINIEFTNNEINEEETEIEEIIEEPVKDIPNIIEENYTEITDIPELKVTSQKNKKVEFLEIKKINIENKENTENFDTKDKEIETHREILSKTIVKWKNYTKRNTKSKTHTETHNKKIDNFLENLQKFQLQKIEKSKSDLTNKNSQEIITTKIKPKSSTSYETKVTSFEYRFKAQKDIIEMQKQKLEEQNRLIEDLKLNRIKKDARESLEKASEMKKSILQNSKHKYKLKQKPETESENNENELNLSLSFNKAPKLVKKMEDRARERHERRLLIQERKRIIDEEKKRQAEELVQRQQREETEEKQQRLERMKKQRDLVRQIELKKQKEKKRYIQLNETALEHYKTKLKKSAFEKLKMLVYMVKIKSEIAKRFYENNIVIICFKSWHKYSSNIINNKNKMATDLFRKNLMQKMLRRWKSFQFEAVQCKQVAIDRYEMSLQSKCFIEWHKLICEYRIQYAINSQKADRYYKRALLFQCLENWRSLPAIMEIERVQNERKRKWRLRVAEVLSDYDPLKNYEY